MTQRDPDAWWSPVPGLPASTEPSPSPSDRPYPDRSYPDAWRWPAPYAPDALVAPSPVRPRRRAWPWVAGGGAVVVLVVGAVLVATLGGPATKTLMDRAGTVSIAVPRSWYDNSGEPGANPDEPPVLAASNLWQDRWVEVDRWDVDDQDTLASFHEDGITHECAQQRCSRRSGAKPLTVGGHPALEQVVVHPSDPSEGASTLVVLTVWLDDRAIEVYAGADSDGDTAPDAVPLEAIAASLRLL